jgi:hypothetical protein
MFGSTILDAAIGMVFIYLLISLVISAANEFIAGIFESRARNLWKGLQALLQDRTDDGFVARLYRHPLIDGLSKPKSKPSYIPSRTFALALLDLVAPAKTDAPRTFDELKAGLANLPEPLQKTLTTLLEESQHDVERLKTTLETWFNSGMERVAGWYKRKTQYIQFCLALVLAGVLNIDSVHAAQTLFAVNSPLREPIVQSAKEFAKPGNTSMPPKDVTSAIGTLALPIGWSDFSLKERWPTFLLGWLITALAVSLGAPFWFDLLNKFINVRSVGKAPEERPKEPKEVPQPKTPGGNETIPDK